MTAGLTRRDWLAAAALAGVASPGSAAAAPKTLRVAFSFAETGFDPLQVSDTSSLRVCAHIFEPLLTYDYLARPAKLVPLTAAALPEASADFRRWVFTLKPGIFFADDPAFKGRRRELTAADVVYTIKRFFDPRLHSDNLYLLEAERILGLGELRRKAIARKTPFEYDTEVEGLRMLDRYRLELRLAAPSPRLPLLFTYAQTGVVAREVVEAYGSDLMEHPVGTGPFRLAQWRRGSAIVLVRNPGYREQRFESTAPTGDAQAQAAEEALRGKRLPLLDRVEISIIDEAQPRWLAFNGGALDVLALPPEFADLAMPGGELAPYLARRGVGARRELDAAVTQTFFNFADPMVGGYTPECVALRRAIALAIDNEAEIRLVLHDQAIRAQSLIPPHCYGHDPALKSELSEASLARANALLDLYGYGRPGPTAPRTRPDGSPLVLRLAATPDQRSRRRNELWNKRLAAVGLRVEFETAPFGELIKRSVAGQLMMWGFSWTAGAPDGDFFLGMAYGPNANQSNDARFSLPAYDRLYERQRVLPDGAERLALMRQAERLMLAYMPYVARHFPIVTDLVQPRVRGYIQHPFVNDTWRYTEVLDGPAA
ncbi:MAG TPA: ABC transporter substrate-binding protein [Burkholderiaceae bacterium]|nr:ABC transporter substrate-binding protein [Burkholderiaceae bacterium]